MKNKFSFVIFISCFFIIQEVYASEIFDPQSMVEDLYNLASQGSAKVRFGAILIDKHGKIVGEGRNRLRETDDDDFFKELIIDFGFSLESRPLHLPNYSVHAEMAAIKDAIQNNAVLASELTDLHIFILGVNKKGLIQLRPSAYFACKTCSAWLSFIDPLVHLHTLSGWQALPGRDTLITTKAKIEAKFWVNEFEGRGETRWHSLESVLSGSAYEQCQKHFLD